MDGRRLVQHGPATLMVSLPAKWLKKNDLAKGDEINVEEKGNELLLKGSANKTKKQIEIKITSDTESSIRAILTNLYRLSYEKITLNYADDGILKVIEKETKSSLIGFEIIKRSKGSCIIENILEHSKDQFDNIQSKLFLNIDYLFLAINGFSEGKKTEFESTESQIQSFDNFCRRMIAKGSYDDAQLWLAFHSAVYHAQRDLYYALKLISTSKVKSNSLATLSEEAKNIFDHLIKAIETKDFSLLEKIHKLEKEATFEKGYNLLKKCSDPNERLVLHRILSSIRNFYSASSPLMGLSILGAI